MSNQIKELEIKELEAQNNKRKMFIATSFVVGAITGYAVSRQMKIKKGETLNFVLAGSLLFGLGYWAYTWKKATRRKNAIQEKMKMIEYGTTKPAPAPSPTDTQPTTVVELTPKPTPPTGMSYKN